MVTVEAGSSYIHPDYG